MSAINFTSLHTIFKRMQFYIFYKFTIFKLRSTTEQMPALGLVLVVQGSWHMRLPFLGYLCGHFWANQAVLC
jgi:hypothetical protein